MPANFDELAVYADELMARGDRRGEQLARLLAEQPIEPVDASDASDPGVVELELGVTDGRMTTLRFVDRLTRLGDRFVRLAAQLARLPASRSLRALHLDAARHDRNLALLDELGRAEVTVRPEILVVGSSLREIHTFAPVGLASVSWWREPSSGVRSMFVCSDRTRAWRDDSSPLVRRVALPWTDRPSTELGAALDELAEQLLASSTPSPELRVRTLRALWDRDPMIHRRAADLVVRRLADALPELELELLVPHSFRGQEFGHTRLVRRGFRKLLARAPAPDRALLTWSQRVFER